MTQKQLASITGCHHSAISKWENAYHRITPYELGKLMYVLDIPIEMVGYLYCDIRTRTERLKTGVSI